MVTNFPNSNVRLRIEMIEYSASIIRSDIDNVKLSLHASDNTQFYKLFDLSTLISESGALSLWHMHD